MNNTEEMDQSAGASKDTTKTTKNNMTKRIGLAVVGVAVLALVAYVVYAKMHPTSAQQQARTRANADEVVAKVAKHMLLPIGDTPVVSDIVDPAKLIAEKPFFTGSIKGDKLVLFPKSAKAIIYSPSRDIIVNSGPFSVEQTPAAQKQAPAPKTEKTEETPAETPSKN